MEKPHKSKSEKNINFDREFYCWRKCCFNLTPPSKYRRGRSIRGKSLWNRLSFVSDTYWCGYCYYIAYLAHSAWTKLRINLRMKKIAINVLFWKEKSKNKYSHEMRWGRGCFPFESKTRKEILQFDFHSIWTDPANERRKKIIIEFSIVQFVCYPDCTIVGMYNAIHTLVLIHTLNDRKKNTSENF